VRASSQEKYKSTHRELRHLKGALSRDLTTTIRNRDARKDRKALHIAKSVPEAALAAVVVLQSELQGMMIKARAGESTVLGQVATDVTKAFTALTTSLREAMGEEEEKEEKEEEAEVRGDGLHAQHTPPTPHPLAQARHPPTHPPTPHPMSRPPLRLRPRPRPPPRRQDLHIAVLVWQ